MWTTESAGSAALASVWGSSANDVYAVGAGGTIVHSTGDGKWTAIASGCSDDLHDVWGSSASDIYIVGAVANPTWSGSVLHSVDGGKTFGLMRMGNLDVAVWGSGANDVYVADYGVLHHSADGGATWSSTTLPTLQAAAVWGASAGDVFAFGNTTSNQQAVARTHDAFADYDVAMPGANDGLLAAWGSSANDIWAVGAPASVSHSSDDGATWQTVTPPGDLGGIVSVWGASAGDVYVLASRGGLLHTSDAGATWTSVTLPGSGYAKVWGSSASDLYVVGSAGQILHGRSE